jgi:hypothetical protein
MIRYRPDNLLKNSHPNLFKQILPEKNPGINLDRLTKGNDKKLTFLCENSTPENLHYYDQCLDRKINGNTLVCLYCNSFGHNFPHLLERWDYELNVGVDPFKVAKYDNKKYHFICKKPLEYGRPVHKYSNTLNHIAQRGDGCPYCSSKRVDYLNSLAFKNPQLASQYHPTKK